MNSVIPNLIFDPAFLDNPDALYNLIRDSTDWDERMHARKTASFGAPYNYSGITYPERPMPTEISSVADSVRIRLGYRPNNCLVNYYECGDSTMGFHSDSIEELTRGTGVAIVSLGAERVLRFRRIDDKSVLFDQLLPNGSLLYMRPEVQLEWKHAVPAQAGTSGRISLTFRHIAL